MTIAKVEAVDFGLHVTHYRALLISTSHNICIILDIIVFFYCVIASNNLDNGERSTQKCKLLLNFLDNTNS